MSKETAALAVPVRRIHWLDGLRSGLMLLGVVLHAAYPYSLGSRWLVQDPQRAQFFQWLTRGIHLFRMPAFFLIAGYFATLLLRRCGVADFLRERARRIGVPLLSTLLTFNLLQSWLLQKHGASATWLPTGQALQTLWSSGGVVGHLWFLVYLLVFCAVLAACARPLRRLAASSRWPARAASVSGVWILLAAAVGCGLLVVALEHLAPRALDHEYLGLIDPAELLSYAPFFAMGTLLELDPSLLSRFSSPGPGSVLTGAIALGAMVAESQGAGLEHKALHLLASSLLVWIVLRLLLGGFRRLANRASALFGYLSDASYSVYLMHHLFVVALSTWLLAADWGPWSKFATVLSLTLALSLAIHHFLVLRHPLLRFLFNGKPLHAPEVDAVSAQPARVGNP
ncbi:MAG: acyltransferase family protein [Pseudoxanthomonas sp.]